MTEFSLRPRLSPRPGTPKFEYWYVSSRCAHCRRTLKAPRNTQLIAIGDLSLDRSAARLLEQASVRRAHHQRRHEVFENGPRPGDERGASADRRDGASEAEPMACRDVVLGDREEAGQARLGGEQVNSSLVSSVPSAVHPIESSRRCLSSRKSNFIPSAIPRAVASMAARRCFRLPRGLGVWAASRRPSW